MRLNFAADLPKATDNKRFLKYLVTIFETINKQLSSRVVSVSIVNTLLSFISPLDYMVIVTDEAGKIRFVNSVGEKWLLTSNREMIGKQLDTVVTFKKRIRAIKKGGKAVNESASLNRNSKPLKASWEVVTKNTTEITEYLYVFSEVEKTKKKEYDLELEDKQEILALTQITALASQLETSKSKAKKEAASTIYQLAWSLKEKKQGSISELLLKLPPNYSYINFNSMTDKVVSSFSLKVLTTVNFYGPFFRDQEKLEKLFHLVLSYFEKSEKKRILLDITPWNNKGVLILAGEDLEDTGEQETPGPVLLPIKKAVLKLDGELVLRRNEKGINFAIFLPHFT